MTGLKLIIFDCDGTLADSLASIEQAMTAAFVELSLPVPRRQAIQQTIGLSLNQAMAILLPPPQQHDAVLIETLVTSYRQHSFRIRNSLIGKTDPLFAGARTTLDALSSAGYLMAIATGKSRRGTQALIEGHDLHGYFVSLQTADDNPGKPSPVMVERALRDAGADIADAVVIGDTVFDIQMAGNAGVAGIGVSWGYHPYTALSDAGAQLIAHAFDDLPAMITATIGTP